MDLPIGKYKAVIKVKSREGFNLPIIDEFREFSTFGDKLIKLPQKKAEAFILIQSIIDIKNEVEAAKNAS